MIETRQLRYFVVVSEELHFGRAAERLHMAQSPLSHQIRNLERTLGVQLIHRGHHVMGLTSAGSVFFEAAKAILDQLDRATEEARRADRGEAGTLRIGYAGEATAELVRHGLTLFKKRYPTVALDLAEAIVEQLIDDVRENRLDIAVLRSSPGLQSIEFEKVFEEPLMAAIPVGWTLSEPTMSLNLFAGKPFIVPSRRTAQGLHAHIEAAFADAGFEPNVVDQANSLGAALLLVAAGAGVTLVPRLLAQSRPRHGVHFVPLDPAPVTSAGVAWRRGNAEKVIRHFIDVLCDYDASIEQSPIPCPRSDARQDVGPFGE